jgi:hypothetical protein
MPLGSVCAFNSLSQFWARGQPAGGPINPDLSCNSKPLALAGGVFTFDPNLSYGSGGRATIGSMDLEVLPRP